MIMDLKQLKKEIFDPIASRIKERSESLRNIKRFPRTGIEGWFKVEILSVLDKRVSELQNKGPDLLLNDGTEIEIKAATDFHKGFFLGPVRKYKCPCLFLGDGKKASILTNNADEGIEIVGYEVFPDDEKDWLIGLVSPKL
jgi:hypothetical protein